MSYLNQINRAVEYIEENLMGDLQIESISRKAGLSKWHFQRIFRAMVGDTVKEYITLRRLSIAAYELVNTDKKVLDIALACEFDSHEVFTRAFQRVFGATPSDFRASVSNNSLIPQKAEITFDYLNHLYKGVSMEPKFIMMKEETVIGVAGEIKSVKDPKLSENFRMIPQLWQTFKENIAVIPQGLLRERVGLIQPVQASTDELEYVAGVVVTGSVELPRGFVERKIPAGEYAEFEHKGSTRTIDHTMNYIYGSWLPKSGYQRGEGPEIGLYGERFKPESDESVLSILIPVCR